MPITAEQIKTAADALGMSPSGIFNRINQGWSEESALTTPRYAKKPNQRTTRKVTDRVSRTVTTTTRTPTAPAAPKAYTLDAAGNVRIVVDLKNQTFTIESIAA